MEQQMQNMEEVLADQIKEIILDETGLEPHEVGIDTALLTSGLVDSFTFVTILTLIESSQGVKIPPHDLTLENFDTIGNIISLCKKHARTQ